ncbi:GNAT family N-acetyltransferase [Photobacterium sanguinicancri]|uniref:GNAT family N-acetyltransferase n=1 Tax=Photobacterium sanguinicancri TaxID=875932 RepID=A0ABX4FXW7_9GAMM|nr:GNAT family N-acetyltransferase [Photobacterium sanguinicancri]OZS43738.1 GNAT family N-acetyltransferase [Photobacterium sanguinicancri]
MQWHCLPFEQLTTHQLYELLKVRVDVFVVEQNCPYHELDEHDRHPDTQHLLAYDNNQLVAYLRLLPPGVTYDNVSIGRVLTTGHARGKGLGHKLLTRALDAAQVQWPDQTIDIGAQDHLQAYYKGYGFSAISEMYLEDDIPHIDMRLEKAITR